LIIEKQYFNCGIHISYHGNDNHYDYKNSSLPHPFYDTGYDNITLNDVDGTFYIIHPDELQIKRNIVGKIIGADIPIQAGKITSYKISSFWDILQERQFLLKNIHNGTYIKTEFGDNVNRLAQEIKIRDIRYIISYLYSRKYNIYM